MAEIGVLLPVRIETRFKDDGLWVRIVPDEPWFVRDDPRITDAELSALERYVAAPREPAADGVPASWRSLATQVGAPRAVYLHRRFVEVAPDGRLTVRQPIAQERRSDATFSRIEDFPPTLTIWLRTGRAAPRPVLRLQVDRARLLADFADPDVPGDRRWWEDWNEAVAAGLAGVVPASELDGAIDALYVTGLGGDDPAPHFDAIAADGRLGLLEPGTPTNVVDNTPAAPLATDAAVWWAVLNGSPGDADRDVSRALCGDPLRLGNLPGGERPHRKPASDLVTAMWPALWGFAAAQVFDLARGPAPARWAARSLFPEGAYPILRIGPQPYGLLATTAWTAWEAADGDPPFEVPLVKGLLQLRDGHARASRRRGTASGRTTEELLDLLSDTPTSSRFRYRRAWPLEVWWLGMKSTGRPDAWRPFAEAWTERHPLADQLDLSPLRRYATRGPSRRIGLPLVVPRGSRAEDLPDMLRKLADAALATPSAFASTRSIEQNVLQLTDSSLLLRLAVRSLQLTIADVRRESEGVTRFDPEPFSRNRRQKGRLEELIGASTAIDTTNPTRASQRVIDVAAALAALGTVAAPTLERMLAAAIDCSNHRIDSWFAAPPQRRLDELLDRNDTVRRLGAYGWVDNPAAGSPGPTAAGVLHAPAPRAAIAAAVLRNRAMSEDGGRWDLDITSRRARIAERLAQHVRVGAHLAEALGREIERIVGAGVGIEQLRRDFPVRTEHAGRRVCDGLRVLSAQPFPLALDAAQAAAVQELREGLDAYADLLVADAVAHLAEGRPDVAGAIMNGAAGLARPPELSLLRTPREGRAVSSSVVLALAHVPDRPLPATDEDRALVAPAVTLDPSVARFLESEAGAAPTWTFEAKLTDGNAPARLRTVSLDALGLAPADALSLTRTRLDALAIERAAELDNLDLTAPGVSAVVVGGTAGAKYEHAVRLVGLIGRTPATARSVSENASALPEEPAAMDPQIVGRYAAVREAGEALARGMRDQVARLGPGGEIGSADASVLLRLTTSCARWGIAPDPRPRETGSAAPPVPLDRRRLERLIDRAIASLQAIEDRLTSAPIAAAAAQLGYDDFTKAAAALVSPTGQVALTQPVVVSTLPDLTRIDTLDPAWLTVVAAVRPPLARLEAHQLAAAAPLSGWTNRPTDPWQTNASDTRRMVAVFTPPQIDFAALAPAATVAVAVIDAFSEVVPAAEVFTGAAFGFDAPASRAPQAILLAVPPSVSRPLEDETIVQIVTETRDLAHARMARPVDLDPQFWALAPTGLVPAAGAVGLTFERRE